MGGLHACRRPPGTGSAPRNRSSKPGLHRADQPRHRAARDRPMGLCPGNRTRARPADIGRVAPAVPYPAHVTPRDLLGRLYDAFNRRAYDEAMTLLHPDFIEDWPQSGEVIRGPANLRAILENYPGGVDLEAAPAYHGRDEEWAITPGYTV